MSTRLSRSVPYWILVAGSAASIAGGAYLLVDKLGGMDTRLTDGSATSNDVYVGQIWAVFGAILVGAGLVGLALALTLGALRAFSADTASDPETATDEVAPVLEDEPALEDESAAELTSAPEEELPLEAESADPTSADAEPTLELADSEAR
ncbi:MAG: dinucleotide-utilizing enzyme [Microbacterium sp.]